jgi:hypothetical protein
MPMLPLATFHVVLTQKSSYAQKKPLVTVSPPPQTIRRVTLCPFPIVTYKVARRRKSFQFSLAVCLVTGSPTQHSQSAEPSHQFLVRTQSGKAVWKNRFRGSLSIYPHQPICKRKMNACWDARHVCARIITHTHASTPSN